MDETPAGRARFLVHRAQHKADWRVSLPKTPSGAKMLMIKNPASFITKQIAGSSHIAQSQILHHGCSIRFVLSGTICTNKKNSNNDHLEALTVTAENQNPLRARSCEIGGHAWTRCDGEKQWSQNNKRGCLDEGLSEFLNLLQR